MDLNAEFKIGKYNVANNTWTWIDLESYTPFNDNGAKTRYRKCTGLETKGKVKNIYSETYAEHESERVSIPQSAARESTEISLDIVFLEKDGGTEDNYYNYRQQHYQNMYDYLKGCLFVYWDNIRKRAAVCYLKDSVSISEDLYIGEKPYIEVEFKMVNIYGESVKLDNISSVESFASQLIIESLS